MFRKKKDPLREVDAILLDHENRIAALVANAALLEETNVEDSLTPEDETGVEECAPSPIVVPTWMRWWHERANSLRKRIASTAS